MAKLSIFLIFTVSLIATISALRCYEGTVAGLDSTAQTAKKECGGMSNYCIQRIDKKRGELRCVGSPLICVILHGLFAQVVCPLMASVVRECSSWSDEHSMEEKCPMTGCHFQDKDSTFCCCQFDECNEWKGDGTEFKAGETSVITKTAGPTPKLPDVIMPTAASRKNKSDSPIDIPTTPAPTRKSSFVDLP